LTSVPTNENRQGDAAYHRDNKSPDRQDDVENCTDREESNEPRESVTGGETTLHVRAIDRYDARS
jgi:hypothetical protein